MQIYFQTTQDISSLHFPRVCMSLSGICNFGSVGWKSSTPALYCLGRALMCCILNITLILLFHLHSSPNDQVIIEMDFLSCFQYLIKLFLIIIPLGLNCEERNWNNLPHLCSPKTYHLHSVWACWRHLISTWWNKGRWKHLPTHPQLHIQGTWPAVEVEKRKKEKKRQWWLVQVAWCPNTEWKRRGDCYLMHQ